MSVALAGVVVALLVLVLVLGAALIRPRIGQRRGCGNCVYWRSDSGFAGAPVDDATPGQCRRELPKVLTMQTQGAVIGGGRSARDVAASINAVAFWPPVDSSKYCGVHRRR